MARRHWSRTLFICSLPLVLAGGGACGDGSAIGTDDTSDVKDVLFPDVADTLVPDTLVPDTVAPDSVTPDTVSPDSELPDVADTDEPVDTEHPDVADTVDAADAADTADTSATPQVDWCRLQFPLDLTVGTATPVMVYGRVYVDGLTNLTTGNDLSASLVARVGRGGHGTDPATWTSWAVAAPNTAWDATAAGELHNDEYVATLPPAQTPGTYDFAYAFSYDGGQSWTYCDRDAGDGHDGSEDGYQSDNAGVMIVVPNPCVPNPCADPPTECVGAVLREYLEPGVCTDDGGAPACAYSDFIDTNCAEDGESCDPVALTCVETGCEPNPCTVGKAPTCDGDTVVSYALNGTCDESSGAVQCTYAEAARVTCDGAAPYCAAGACVAWRPAGVGDVVISEVMPQPNAVSDALGEWFELENVSADTVNLKGLQITNAAGGETFTVGADLVLAPGGVAVFGRSTDTAVNGGAPVDALMAPMTLANAGDSIHVWRDGTLVDAVAWTSSWPFAKGVAMSLPPSKATAADNDAAASWCKAYVAYGDGDLGTPGVKNGVCKLEIGWCRLQFPTAITVAPSATFDVYAHLFVEGLTNLDAGANPHPLLRAEVGRGASGSQPSGWTGWVTAAPNPAFDAGGEPSNDEYMAPLTAPATAGSYDFAYRFSGDRGATWVYCDRDAGAGSDGSADGYQPANAGKLTVSTAGPCSPNPCTTPPAACVGDVLHAYATPGTCAVVGAMGECSYDETGTTDCTATGKVCDEGTRACVTPASACVPNPCTAVPAATCDGNDLLTYAAVCDDGTGEAACSYPVTRTTCPAEAPVCSAGACVAARLAGVGDLVITEVMADPAFVSDSDGEWFEVKNVAAVAVNLNGLAFQDDSGPTTTVDTDLIVQPNGYALFVRTADTATNGGLTADATFRFNINNGGDVITITRGADLIDAADFRSTAMNLPFQAGVSYQLAPDKTTAADNDVAANWCVGTTPISATNTDKGTPRADNTACGVTIERCRLQAPAAASAAVGSAVDVYGRLKVPGLTDVNQAGNDPSPFVVAEVGVSPLAPASFDPSAWIWTAASPNAGYGTGSPAFEPTYDEYQGSITAPAAAGSYRYAVRFSGDSGATWTYCDLDQGAGHDGSEDGFALVDAGALTVTDPCSPNPCQGPAAECLGSVLHTYVTPGTCTVSGGAAECSYDETGATDCAATGQVCDAGTGACETPVSPCAADPCTAVPAATCDGNDLLTYATVCDDGTGAAVCSYPETRTTCPAEAPVCSAGACVAARLAGVGDLVITEVMADPEAVADDKGEWFEVKNVAAVAVNLKGLKLQDGSATVTTVTNDLVVQPGGYALFVRTADTATNGGLVADATFDFAINNGSTADVITITRGADLIDAADFRSTAMGLAFPKGASYQLAPDKTTAADNDVAANWCVGTTPISATNTDKGTPRADNTACGGAAQCEPNPCTTPTAATCTGDTYQSYASPGTCTPGASTPTCEYAPNAPVDCSATGGRCSAADGGCVACLDNDDCGVPFEACDIGTHACVAACIDDGYEGNDSLASAVVLTTDIMATDLVICSDNGDFFAMDLIAGQKVDALIEFDPSMADLSLTLYDPMGAVVATSDTGADFEELTYTPATAGRYVLAVTAPVGEQALYDLTLTFAPDACTGVVCNTPPSGCASGSYQSYQTPGSCAVVDGHADCSYVANTPVDCGALGQVCSDADGGCVGCLATSDCDVPFEVCDTGAHACVAQCTDDGYEPNDSVGAPAVLTADLLATDLVLCADNDDYYALDMLSGQDIDALMELDSAAGVLDLALLDPAGDVVATPLADGDSASLSYTTTEAGRWTLRVSAAAGVRNVYDLTVLWYVAACAPNPCTNPAAPYCAGTHLITEPATGACAETGSGAYTCDYASGATDTACDAFCNAGACTTWRPVSVAGDLVVSEIMARPTAADGQYVELYNASGVALNLNGVTVYDITAGDELVIGADLIVEAGAYVVLGESADTGANGGVAVDYVWSGFTLDPTEDEVALAALDGTDIDDVMYDASWPFTAGVALGFDPTLVGGASAVTDNDAPANWCGATSTIANGDHGTPGAANDACLAPLTFGFCRLQYPPSMAVVTGGEATVYGRLYVATLTTENEFSNDPDARVLGQVGYGPTGSQPTEASWTWAAGSPNDGYGPPGAEANNDEYMATLTAPVTVGTYDYAFRFSVDGGATWHACDQDGVTGDGNLTYDPAQAGVLTVTPPKLLITEYVEGSSNNKALEVTNLGESPLDLAALGCEFRFYNAPGDSPPHSTTISNAVALTTTLDPRASWVVCDDESSATVLSLCDQPDNDSFFNGDDPVELACGGQVIDSVGRRGITTNFGKDVTFHRKCTVSEGDGVSDDAFDPAVEWDALPKDTFSGLGSHAPVLQPTVTGVAGKALVIDAIDLLSTPRRVRVRNVSAGAVTITPDWRWAQDPTFEPVVGGDTVIASKGSVVFELPVAYSFAPGSTFELGLYASSDFDAPTALAAYVEANAAWQPREGVAVSAALWTAGGFAPAPAGIGGLVLVPSAAIGTPAAYTTYGDQCRL